MDLGERDRGIFDHDLAGRHPHLFVPDGNMLDLDAMAKDVRLPAAVAGFDTDMLGDDGPNLGGFA